jgi:predicted secreted protein
MLVGDTTSGAGGYDFYVVKTDADGNVQWSNTYSGLGWDRAYGGVVQTSDGGYAIDGYTSSYGAGSYDFWLIKIDANGKMLWNKTYGGLGEDIAEWIIQTSDGGFALSGKTTSFGAGGFDAWLVKTDSDGNMQWNKTYGGPNDDLAGSVIQTSDGGYLFSASTYSFGAGGRDFWLIKTDQLGNMEWNKTYGGPNGDGQGSVSLTSDGGYAIVGWTYSFGAGGSDGWFVKTDANGNVQWNKTFGGPLEDGLSAALQTADGGYFLLGQACSFGAGGQDIWLIKADQFGNMEWNKTFGGPYDEYINGPLIATTDGGLAITGWTYSFGAGAEDMYLVKTSVNPPASNSGLAWIDSSPSTITLRRASGDSLWNYVRVRVAQVS